MKIWSLPLALGAFAACLDARAALPTTRYQLCEAKAAFDMVLSPTSEQPMTDRKSPDGRLVPVQDNGRLRIVDAATFRGPEAYDDKWIFEETQEELDNPRDSGFTIDGVSWSPSGRFLMVSAYDRGDAKTMLIDRATKRVRRFTKGLGSWLSGRDLIVSLDFDGAHHGFLSLLDPATGHRQRKDLPGLPTGSFFSTPKNLDDEITASTAGDTYQPAKVVVYSLKTLAVRAQWEFPDFPGATLEEFDEKRNFAVLQTIGSRSMGGKAQLKVVRLSDHAALATFDNDVYPGQLISPVARQAGDLVVLTEFPEGDDEHTDRLSYHSTFVNVATGAVQEERYDGPYVAYENVDAGMLSTQQLSVFGQIGSRFTLTNAQREVVYEVTSPADDFISLDRARGHNSWFAISPAKTQAHQGLTGLVDYRQPVQVYYNNLPLSTLSDTWMEGVRYFKFEAGDAAKHQSAHVRAWDLNQNCQPSGFLF